MAKKCSIRGYYLEKKKQKTRDKPLKKRVGYCIFENDVFILGDSRLYRRLNVLSRLSNQYIYINILLCDFESNLFLSWPRFNRVILEGDVLQVVQACLRKNGRSCCH
jgi:hypothetical protein